MQPNFQKKDFDWDFETSAEPVLWMSIFHDLEAYKLSLALIFHPLPELFSIWARLSQAIEGQIGIQFIC
jgi:hypothetical protein